MTGSNQLTRREFVSGITKYGITDADADTVFDRITGNINPPNQNFIKREHVDSVFNTFDIGKYHKTVKDFKYIKQKLLKRMHTNCNCHL